MRHRTLPLLCLAALLAGQARADDPPTQAEQMETYLATVRQLVDDLGKTPGTVVAEIGNRSVTRADVAEALRTLPPARATRKLDLLFHDAVQGLLAQQALVIRAQEQGLDKDSGVRPRIEAATDGILVNAYLTRAARTAITEATLHDLYDREVAGKPGPEEVRARVIRTTSAEQATKILARLADGADFGETARQFSSDSSAPAGGDIGFVRLDAVLPEIGAVLFALAPGQTTANPVRVAGALFILRVEARRQQATPDFEAMRPVLVQQLIRQETPSIVQQAMAGLPVKDYGMTGKPAAR